MAEASFNARLMEAMKEMVNPSKTSVATVPTKGGGKYTYRYETLDQVLAIVRPALMRNGFGLTQYMEGGVLVTAVFDESEFRIMDGRNAPTTSDPQAFGSWETYMRRYALRSVFGLCGEDDDGNAAKPKPAAASAPKRIPAKLERYMGLKDHAAAVGIKPEGIASWMRTRFPGKKLQDLAPNELNEAEAYIETLISDREQLNARPME